MSKRQSDDLIDISKKLEECAKEFGQSENWMRDNQLKCEVAAYVVGAFKLGALKRLKGLDAVIKESKERKQPAISEIDLELLKRGIEKANRQFEDTEDPDMVEHYKKLDEDAKISDSDFGLDYEKLMIFDGVIGYSADSASRNTVGLISQITSSLPEYVSQTFGETDARRHWATACRILARECLGETDSVEHERESQLESDGSLPALPEMPEKDLLSLLFDLFFGLYLENFDRLQSGANAGCIPKLTPEQITGVKRLVFVDETCSFDEKVLTSTAITQFNISKMTRVTYDLRTWQEECRHMLVLVLFNRGATKPQCAKLVELFSSETYSAKNIKASAAKWIGKERIKVSLRKGPSGKVSQERDGWFQKILELLGN